MQWDGRAEQRASGRSAAGRCAAALQPPAQTRRPLGWPGQQVRTAASDPTIVTRDRAPGARESSRVAVRAEHQAQVQVLRHLVADVVEVPDRPGTGVEVGGDARPDEDLLAEPRARSRRWPSRSRPGQWPGVAAVPRSHTSCRSPGGSGPCRRRPPRGRTQRGRVRPAPRRVVRAPGCVAHCWPPGGTWRPGPVRS